MGNCISSHEEWFSAAIAGNQRQIERLREREIGSLDEHPNGSGRLKDFTALMYAAFYGHAGIVKQLVEQEYDVYNEVEQQIPILSQKSIHLGFETKIGYSALEMSLISGTFSIANILISYYFQPEEIQRFYCFEPPHDIFSLLILNNSEEALQFFEKHFDGMKHILAHIISWKHLALTQLIGNTAFAELLVYLASSQQFQDISRLIRKFCEKELETLDWQLPASLIAPHTRQDDVRFKFIAFHTGERPLTIPKYLGDVHVHLRISVTEFLNQELSDSTQHSFTRKTHRPRSYSIGYRKSFKTEDSAISIDSPATARVRVDSSFENSQSANLDAQCKTSCEITSAVGPSQLCLTEALTSDSLTD